MPRRERNSLRYDSVTGEYVTQEELNRRIAERQKKHTFVDKSPLTKNTYSAQKSTGGVSNSPLLKNTYADRGLDSSRYIDYSKPYEISANKTTLPKQTPLYIDSATGDKVSLEEWNRRRQARLHADYSKPEELKSITQKSNISSSDKKYIDYNTGEKVTLEEWNRRRADKDYYKNELDKMKKPEGVFDTEQDMLKWYNKVSRLEKAVSDIDAAEQRKKTEEYYDNLKTERRELERATQRKDFYLNVTKGREKEFGSFNSLKNYLTSQTNKKRNPLEFIKQKEKDVYDYYVGKGQEATAASYLDAIMPELNKRMTERATREAYEFGQEHKILSYPSYIVGSIGAGIGPLLETGRQAISNELTGKFVPVDTNSAAMLQQNKQDALAYGLTENYGPWGKFFAETGLSIASMATILPLGKIGSLAVMSSNAGGSTALNALNNGASPNQALTLGVTAAVIEAATEKIGLDNLFKLAGKPTKAIARAIASQVGAEGLEETISQYANHIADMGIMGENSEYNRYIKELERVGFTREQAEHDAKRKFLLQDPLKALLGGAISGGVFGGVGASVGNYQTDASTQNTEKPMVSYGVDVDTETKTFLEKVANKTGINIEVAEIYDKNGKQMSNAEGYYDRSQNKMVFAPDTSKSDVIKGVVMHELTHSIEGSKFYNEYVKFAINTQYKGTEDFKSAIQDKIQQYAKQNIELKPIDAQKELVAEITRNTIFDEAAINKLVAEKPNIAIQIYESIVKAIDMAKAYVTGDTETIELEKARKLFEKALNERGVNTGTDTRQYALMGKNKNNNKKIEASPPIEDNKSSLNRVLNASDNNSITDKPPVVKPEIKNNSELTKQYMQNSEKDTRKRITEAGIKTYKPALALTSVNQHPFLFSDGTITHPKYSHLEVAQIAVGGKRTSKELAEFMGYGNIRLSGGDGEINVEILENTKPTNEQWEALEILATAAKRVNYDISGENMRIIKSGTVSNIKELKRTISEYKKDTRQMSVKGDASIERAKKAVKEFGTTFNFNEAGYITVEGKLLDFSGKKDGGPSNTRSMDHREIETIYEGEAEWSDALVKFMNEGNIRLLPEYGGIDVSVAPNSKQKEVLRSYINKNQGEITVDFSSHNGDNIGNVEYPKRTSSSKILKDIDTFFETGELPEVSDTGKFLYSIKSNDNEQDKTKRSRFYDNTIKRATAIPQEVKDKLNPASFDFIPESSKEWQRQAEKNVNADMDGVIERLKNAPSISGGIEGHEAAVIAKRLVDNFKKTGSEEVFKKMLDFLKIIASKTREAARALKATDTAWDKTDPAAAVIRAERTVQKVIEDEKRRNPKKFADAESEKKQLQTKMKNAEKLAQKDKAQKKLSDEQTKKIEDKRKKQMLERWVRDTVPRAKQKNMLEKIQEMYEAGAYNDEALARLVSEKRDIPYLSLDEVKKIINYIDKANTSEEGSYEQRMAFSRAEQIIESKMPVTARDKIKAFPRISILTGTRTQIRNIVGNITHGTYEAVRENTIGLLTDIITSKFTGERKLTGNVKGKTGAYIKGFAKGISEWYHDIKNNVDTSPTRTRGEVKRNSRTFNSAFLNAIDAVVKKGLSLGDRPFYQGAYEARMYELAKLNEKAKNKMSIDEMVLDAQAYALDKVYQNDSTVKKVATRLRNVSTAIDNPFWQSVVEVGMTVTVPFTETPANIFDKVLENSPIGLVKAGIELGKTKKGTFNQMKFVQNLSRGMTGTGLMALGAMLLSKGIISIVPWDEEYDKYKFMQSIGAQNYALKIGDKYYSLSWLEPLATPLLVGAEIARGSDNDKNIIENLFGTTKIAIDSFFESSFVQGISELFSSDSIGEGVAKKLLDAHSIFTPLSAFSKALAQWADPYIRETKADNTILQMLKERASETPFLSKTLPTRIDVFGNEVKTLDGENHVFNVFFNPANVTDYVTTEVHDEIIRLYDETKEVTVFPDYISKREVTYDKNKVTLDEKQFEKYKREIGSNLYDEYEKLFKTEAYKNMSPEDKVKAIQSAKSDIKNQSNFNAVKNNEDFLSALTQDKQMYNDKTQLKIDADYATRWEKLTPNDNKVVKDARLLSAVKSAVNAFEKDGLLNKDNMAKISKYVENKRKREPTMMDVNLAAVYRATGDTSVYNGSYNNLIEFTSNGMPYKINYPAGLLLELIARSDSAVLAAYSKIMTSTKWLYMTPVQKQKALTDAKADARAAFEKELKIKYGARLDTTNKKWQAMTPQEKAAAANKGYKIN